MLLGPRESKWRHWRFHSFSHIYTYIHTNKTTNIISEHWIIQNDPFLLLLYFYFFFRFRPAISNFHNLTIFPSRFYPSLWINTDTQLYRWIMQTVRRKPECTRIHNYGLLLRLFLSILFVARNAKNYSHTPIADTHSFLWEKRYILSPANQPSLSSVHKSPFSFLSDCCCCFYQLRSIGDDGGVKNERTTLNVVGGFSFACPPPRILLRWSSRFLISHRCFFFLANSGTEQSERKESKCV